MILEKPFSFITKQGCSKKKNAGLTNTLNKEIFCIKVKQNLNFLFDFSKSLQERWQWGRLEDDCCPLTRIFKYDLRHC